MIIMITDDGDGGGYGDVYDLTQREKDTQWGFDSSPQNKLAISAWLEIIVKGF